MVRWEKEVEKEKQSHMINPDMWRHTVTVKNVGDEVVSTLQVRFLIDYIEFIFDYQTNFKHLSITESFRCLNFFIKFDVNAL